MQHNGDASVVEILETIKKVIERENRETAAAERKLRATRGVPAREPDWAMDDADAGVDEEEVLDLGAAATALDEEAHPAPEPLADSVFTPSAPEEPLVSERAGESMRESFAALSMLAGGKSRDGSAAEGESALEGMVRQMLRPMLAEWLDQNLPEIVERLVRDEIDRIAGKPR